MGSAWHLSRAVRKGQTAPQSAGRVLVDDIELKTVENLRLFDLPLNLSYLPSSN
jgi:hypothetical protein